MDLKPWSIFSITIIVISLIGLLVFRVGWVTFIDSHEFGYKYDKRSGEITPILTENGKIKTGYVITPPIVVSVHTIDLRPVQVCINANSRILNCKLVRFNPEGFRTFIDWHGRGNYDTGVNLKDILLSYAYDGSDLSQYPFLSIKKELKPDEKSPMETNLDKTFKADTTAKANIK